MNIKINLCLILLLNSPLLLAEEAVDWITQDCLLEPNMLIELATPVAGVVSSIKVDKGDHVKKGDTVVRLRSEVEQAMVELHRAEMTFNKTTIRRNDELYQQNLISLQERDELALKRDLAKLELVAARAQLSQKRITSPINGVVLERLVDPGEYVNELPMMKIASLDPLYVEAVLPRELFGSIGIGKRAQISLEKPVGGIHTVKVDIIDQVIDAASGTFAIRLLLANPENKIPAGLKCKLRFSN